MIYLDSAATTLEKPASVGKAMMWAVNNCASPGRGGHPATQKSEKILYECREAAANLFGVQNPEHVVFTSSATHGLNIAIQSTVKPGSKVLISGYEHNAVTRTLHGIPDVRIETAGGPLFRPDIILRSFRSLMDDTVQAVICTHVSNVFGYILPIYDIAQLCKERSIPLIVDASQSAGVLEVDAGKLGASFIAMPGHKGLYGPQGTGLLLCGNTPEPLIYGGTGGSSANPNMPNELPDRLEAGTHNVCGITGLMEGIKFVGKTRPENIRRHEVGLRKYTEDLLRRDNRIELYCGEDQSGVLSVRIRGLDCEQVGLALAKHGIAVRAGLHCAPLAHRSAGTFDTGTVRISFSVFNRMEHVKRLSEAMKTILKIRGID